MKYATTPDGTTVPVDNNGNLITGYLPLITTQDETTIAVTPVATTPTGGGGSLFNTTIPAPIADFTYTSYANGMVGFKNNSPGPMASYQYDFGDGTASNIPNALHQYAANGTYTVRFTIANNMGYSSKTASVIVSNVDSAWTVDFSFVFSGLGIQFTDTSTKAGMRLWNFGDGHTSYETNPYHLYGASGIYLVTLTIDGSPITHQVVIDRGIQLTWQDNATNETGFIVEWSPDGSTWSTIATPVANTTSLLVTYNIHGVDPSAVNYFRVRATNAGGDSANTNVVETQCL